LDELLAACASLHAHLCPRQVLGVRIGLAAAAALSVPVPQADKRLLALVETDGCFTDGVGVATNCWVGRRTMRVIDYGKVALTLVDTQTGAAVRAAPLPTARSAAVALCAEAESRWHAQLLGYQRLPDDQLLDCRRVTLQLDVAALVSRPGVRAICDRCGEDVLNEREIRTADGCLCLACADGAYYRSDDS
jgi:formylmethanofuran dehydrogenase subunit E